MEGDPFREAAKLLQERSGRALPFTPEYRPLPAPAPPTDDGAHPAGATVAVDGSNGVLVDNGTVWVVAVRAAAVTWPGPVPLEPPAQVVATVPAEATERLQRECAPLGLEAPRIPSAEAFAEALRDLEELRLARAALDTLGPADLLLVDGALERLGRPDSPAEKRMERLLEKADARGVPVVGVAKRSRLERDGVPLVPALHRDGPPGAWVVRDPDYRMTHVARLHPDAPHAFRVDATDPAAITRLVPLCRDAVYLGYPYPLALAHNTVVLTAGHLHALRGRLADTVRRDGGPGAYALLEDFHAVLDANVP